MKLDIIKIDDRIRVTEDSDSRREKIVRTGRVVAIEKHFVVLQFKNYREAFLLKDIKHSLLRQFEVVG